MRLVPTRQAVQLTGLSPAQLREWTSRRALIPADVPPRKRGCSAQYSWQTILLLRLAVTLRDRFCLELQAHRPLFTALHRGLRGESFVALWGKALALHGRDRWILFDEAGPEPLRTDAVVLRLNPHLDSLSEGFALPTPSSSAGQLDLFPAAPVGGPGPGAAYEGEPLEGEIVWGVGVVGLVEDEQKELGGQGRHTIGGVGVDLRGAVCVGRLGSGVLEAVGLAGRRHGLQRL